MYKQLNFKKMGANWLGKSSYYQKLKENRWGTGISLGHFFFVYIPYYTFISIPLSPVQ